MNRLAVGALVVALGMVFSFQLTQAVGNSEVAPRASLTGALQYDYRTLADLADAASVIVVANVKQARGIQSGRLPFTESTLLVEDVAKGTVRPGESIRVLETGGLYTPIARDGRVAGLPTQEVDFEGVPVMQLDAKYILFLRPYLGDIVQGGFSVLGVYQGKMRVGASGRIEFAGVRERLDEPTFSVLRYTNGRSAQDVVEEVRDGLHK